MSIDVRTISMITKKCDNIFSIVAIISYVQFWFWSKPVIGTNQKLIRIIIVVVQLAKYKVFVQNISKLSMHCI